MVLTSSGAADCSLFNQALQMMPSTPACVVKVGSSQLSKSWLLWWSKSSLSSSIGHQPCKMIHNLSASILNIFENTKNCIKLKLASLAGDCWKGNWNGGHEKTLPRYFSFWWWWGYHHITKILLPGDLILAEKPVMTMPVAIFDSDRESTEDWLDKVGEFCFHSQKKYSEI